MERTQCKEEEVMGKSKKYHLDILGVSETHVQGSREKEVDNGVMVYLGVTDGRTKGDMAVMISGNLRSVLKNGSA